MTEPRARILVVDDEAAMREVLRERLEAWGYEVETAADGAEGEVAAKAFDPDVILSDVVLPDVSGLELLGRLRTDRPGRPVVLMTAHGTVDMAVEAMKDGAYDFLTKPIDYDNLETLLEVALREIEVDRRAEGIRRTLDREEARLGPLVGGSAAMREVYRLIQEMAATPAPVLVVGESGTGKELVARAVHDHSPRAEGPFVAVNAAAIPAELMESEMFGHVQGAFTGAAKDRAGVFELAEGGTLFLDEIAEMPIGLQPKLLRVLEDGRIRRVGGTEEIRCDVRIVAATNRDPADAIESGNLREDLYYRLNVLQIRLPPLRERMEDLPLLAHHWLEKFREKHGGGLRGFREETLERMRAYRWPGNVRELRNVVERAVVLAHDEWIEPAHLPPYLRTGLAGPDGVDLPVGASLAEVEKALILRTLEETGNNKAEAARRLGVDVKTVRNKLKAWEEEE